MTNRHAWIAAALAFGLATPAMADITITDANIPGNPDENVLLSNDFTAMAIIGLTNQTATPVSFTSDELLNDPPNGQARIEADDGGLDFLEIALVNPLLRFTALEFNLNSSFDGDVSIFAVDNFGTEFSQVLTVDDNGENRINVFATNSQLIKLVRITATGDLDDVRQIRIGGITAVPEPSAWAMMILGFGGVGATLRRRRALYA